MGKHDKRPAEQSAAPACAEIPAEQMAVLVEIRDLLKTQAEFQTWLKDKLIAANALGR